MGKISDLERQRVERLAHDLAPVLRERGHVGAHLAKVESVDRWRRAARRAGRMLGWRVRSGVTRDGRHVWASSEDWPVPPGEYERAARRLNELVFGARVEPDEDRSSGV